MTSDDRAEAERLAWEKFPADDSHVSEQLERDCFIEGYAAGRESRQEQVSYLQREYAGAVSDWDKSQILLRAERKWSRKLIKALNWYWLHWNTNNEELKLEGYKVSQNAIAEYETSRDK